MDFQDQMNFNRIEDDYLRQPEPQNIGRCVKCGWPVDACNGHFYGEQAIHYDCEKGE